MSENFTPGPWTVEPAKLGQLKIAGPFMERGGRYRRIAMLGSPRSYVNEELDAEIAANAHLIAAAPDLYEALDRLLAVAEMTTFSDQYPRECEQAHATLAKARGES